MLLQCPQWYNAETFVENHIILGVACAVHVCSGNQHPSDGFIVHNILAITDNYMIAMKEICQWGIQGVAALVEHPSIEDLLKIKPVFEVLQLWRVCIHSECPHPLRPMLLQCPQWYNAETFVENHIILGVACAVHVCSGNQHPSDGFIVHNILVITDNYMIAMKEICQWGIQGVAALVEHPSIEDLLKIKPVFEVLQLWRVLWSFAFYAILLGYILAPVGQCFVIKIGVVELQTKLAKRDCICEQCA